MNDDDLSDPSVDEDGVSLSHCYGLHEKLQRLDAQFRAIPITDRGPECLRQYALASLAAVCETVDFQATIFSHLSEALTLANEGRRHPIMAVNAHELARSRPANSILAIQGSAAGALEYAFTNLGIRQRDAAKRIADFIASAGFAKSDGRPYTADSIVKWRTACITRNHAGLPHFDDMLTTLKAHNAAVCGFLWLLEIACQHYCTGSRNSTAGKS